MARPLLTRHFARPAVRPRVSLIESLETRRLMANLVVNSLADGPVDTTDTTVTLREAVQVAAAGDTIDLTGLSGTITLGGEIVLDKSLTLVGPAGKGELTVSGGDATRLFRQTAGVVAFNDLTLADGNSGAEGGGAYRNDYGGDVSFDRVVLRDNVAGDSGGAIDKRGDALTLTDSVVLDNAVDATGRNFAYGGGIYASRVNLTIESSTLAGNRLVLAEGKSGGGGGLSISGYQGAVRIVNSTFANNSVVGDRGTNGALYLFETGSVVEIAGTTFANNASADGQSVEIESAEDSGFIPAENVLRDVLIVGSAQAGPNRASIYMTDGPVIENVVVSHGLSYGGGLTNGANGNRFGSPENPLDVRVGALGDHGGPTPTVPLLAGSVGIDAGSASASAADQRGVARVRAADVGSYEYVNTAPSFAAVSLPDAVAGQAYSATVTANDPDLDDPLTITATATPAWLTFTDNGDGTATLAGTPTYADAGGRVELRASDGRLDASFAVTLALAKPNRAPFFTTTSLPAAVADQPYSATVAASDPDAGSVLSISASNLPAWLSLSDRTDGTAVLSGTPTYADVGGNVELNVSDASLADGTFQATLALAKPNRAPTGVTLAGRAVAQNAPVGTIVGTLAASDPDGNDAHTFELVDADSPFAVDAATGAVTLAVPLDYRAEGARTLRVRAVDAGGLSAERDVAVTINNVARPATPAVRREVAEVGGMSENGRDTVDVKRDAAGHTVVTVNGRSTTLDDAVVAVRLDTGDGDDEVTISADAPVIWLDAGAGDDVIRFAPRPGAGNGFNVILGGAGNDYIEGTPGRDAIYGGDGDDTLLGMGGDDALYGEAGDDSLVGGDGDDSLNGGTGNDVMSGGDGTDLAWYVGRDDGVTIRLDGSATSGTAGEADAVAGDVEQALGGDGDDALYGNALANYLVGLGGNDSLFGGDGKDTLDGGDGDDRLDGGDDWDVLYPGPAAGRDRLFGGGGRDRAGAFSFDRITLDGVEERELLAA